MIMATIVLGCDDNDGKNAEWQNTVASALEKNGHTVEKLPIHPTPFGQYSYGEAGYNPKGKIGVYIMADSLVSVADLAYGGTSFKYAYFIIRMDLGKPKMSQPEHFNTSPIGMDGDCSGVCEKLVGKTYSQMNELTKNKCQCTWGRTPKEGAENLIKAMGGEITDTSESSSSSTIKSAICDVMFNWDGEAELFIRDETVHIQKIQSPSKAKLSLIEGENIHLGSITVNDYNPSTVNYLTATFKDYELTIQDEQRVKRFGKVQSEVSIEDDEVKTLDDAKEFLQREWNKLQRDNGHSLECTVRGNDKWKQGEWCRVYLPSFGIDGYMYIINMSQDDSASDKWNCQLTLVDYPPGFGEPSSNDNNSEEFDSDLDTTDTTSDADTGSDLS